MAATAVRNNTGMDENLNGKTHQCAQNKENEEMDVDLDADDSKLVTYGINSQVFNILRNTAQFIICIDDPLTPR